MWNLNIEPTLTKRMVGAASGDLTNVDSSGAVLSLPITKVAEITQLTIRHLTSGLFNVQIFSDVALSNLVFEATGGDTLFALSKMGLLFSNTDSPVGNLVYIKVIPESGTGHNFVVQMFYEKF